MEHGVKQSPPRVYILARFFIIDVPCHSLSLRLRTLNRGAAGSWAGAKFVTAARIFRGQANFATQIGPIGTIRVAKFACLRKFAPQLQISLWPRNPPSHSLVYYVQHLYLESLLITWGGSPSSTPCSISVRWCHTFDVLTFFFSLFFLLSRHHIDKPNQNRIWSMSCDCHWHCSAQHSRKWNSFRFPYFRMQCNNQILFFMHRLLWLY